METHKCRVEKGTTTDLKLAQLIALYSLILFFSAFALCFLPFACVNIIIKEFYNSLKTIIDTRKFVRLLAGANFLIFQARGTFVCVRLLCVALHISRTAVLWYYRHSIDTPDTPVQ